MRLPRPRVTRTAALALGLLTLALATLTTVLAVALHRSAQTAEARRAALAAARASATDVLSYDYRHLDADFAKARKHLTGAFRGQYDKTTASVVAQTAPQFQVVVAARVEAAGVKSASPDRAVVLVMVNQTTTSTKLPVPRVDQNRARLTMAKVDGRWLVARVEAL